MRLTFQELFQPFWEHQTSLCTYPTAMLHPLVFAERWAARSGAFTSIRGYSSRVLGSGSKMRICWVSQFPVPGKKANIA